MTKRSVARPLGTKLTSVSGLHSRSNISDGWSAGSSNMIHQIFRGRMDRMDKYRTYDWMDQDSDISRALDIIAEHCTERDSDHRYFKFHWYTNEAAVEVTELLKAHLDQWSKINRFKRHLFKTVRNMMKYGDWFMFRNPHTFELYDIHPQDVMGAIVDRDSLEILGWMIRDFRWNVADLEIDVKDDSIKRQIQSLTNGNLAGGSNMGNAVNSRLIPAIHILHFSLSEGKMASSGFGRGTGNGTAGMGSVESANPWPFGRSWLDKAHNTFKKRELLEDSIIIHRVQRAPTRLVWYIDVGKMRHDKHTHVVQNFKNELNQKRIPQTIGSNGRGVDSVYNPISQLEDYYIPVSMDQRGSKVEQLDGKPLTDMPDLDYFNKKMASALRVPYAWLQPAGEGGIIPADGRQGKQANTYMNAQALLQKRGLNEMASLVKGLAESGGNASLYLSKNPEMATSLAASGTIDSLYRLANLLNSSTQTNAAFFSDLQRSAAGFKSQTQLGAAGSVVLSQAYQNLSGEAGRAATITANPPELSMAQRLWARVQDIMTNYVGTTTSLVVSLGANTAALIANTIALGGFGKIGGIIKGLGGAILGMPKKMIGLFRGGAAAAGAAAGTSVGATVASSIGSAVTVSTENAMARVMPTITNSVAKISPTIIQTGGAAASASTGFVRSAGGAVASGVRAAGSLVPETGAIMGATRGLGSMITRSLPVIGTIMGIYDAVSRISNGDILGGMWSGAAGIMASINPLASAGMYAGLVGRDVYNSYSSTTTTASPIGGYTGQDPLTLAYPTDLGGQYTSDATVNNGIRNDTQQLIWATNQALYDLISIAQSEVSILRIIANNTSTGQTEIPTGFFDWLTGTAKKEIKKNSAKQAATYSAPNGETKSE